MTPVPLETLVAQARSGAALVSFPTDTVLALATRPDCADLIFVAKQRRPDKPLILMAATPEDLWPFVQAIAPEFHLWQQVAQQYWPGSLTLVLPASDRVPDVMHPTELETIGLRVPNHPLARQILKQTGPLATTSANLSGQPPLTTLRAVETHFPGVLTPALGETPPEPISGTPSTVVKWAPEGWQVLRQGAIRFGT